MTSKILSLCLLGCLIPRMGITAEHPGSEEKVQSSTQTQTNQSGFFSTEEDSDFSVRLNDWISYQLYEKGNRAIKQGKFENAIAHFDRAIQRNANFAEAYHMCGFAHYNLKQFDEAIKDFSKAIKLGSINQNIAVSYFRRADVYYVKKMYKNAIADYTNAISLDSSKPEYFVGRAGCYFALKNFEKAIEDWTKAIELNPDDPEIYSYRSVAYNLTGKTKQAAEDIWKMLALLPQGTACAPDRKVNAGQRIEGRDSPVRACPVCAKRFSNRYISYESDGDYQRTRYYIYYGDASVWFVNKVAMALLWCSSCYFTSRWLGAHSSSVGWGLDYDFPTANEKNYAISGQLKKDVMKEAGKLPPWPYHKYLSWIYLGIKNNKPPQEIAEIYLVLAWYAQMDGNTRSENEFRRRAIEWLEKYLGSEHSPLNLVEHYAMLQKTLETFFSLGENYRRLGNFEKAKHYLEKAMVIYGSRRYASEQKLVLQSYWLAKSSDCAVAHSPGDGLPDNIQIDIESAVGNYITIEDFEKAKELIYSATSYTPGDYEIHYLLGYCELERAKKLKGDQKKQSFAKAKEHFNLVLDIFSEHWPSIAKLSEIARLEGDNKKAKELLNTAMVKYVHVHGFYPSIDYLQEMFSKGKWEEYYYLSDFSVFSSGLRPRTDIAKARAYFNLDDFQSASIYFRHAMRKGLKFDKYDFKYFVESLKKIGQLKQTVRILKSAVKNCPGEYGFYKDYAECLLQVSKPDKAIKFLKQKIKASPKMDRLYVYLADIYSSLERWPDCKAVLEKLLDLHKQDKHTRKYYAPKVQQEIDMVRVIIGGLKPDEKFRVYGGYLDGFVLKKVVTAFSNRLKKDSQNGVIVVSYAENDENGKDQAEKMSESLQKIGIPDSKIHVFKEASILPAAEEDGFKGPWLRLMSEDEFDKIQANLK